MSLFLESVRDRNFVLFVSNATEGGDNSYEIIFFEDRELLHVVQLMVAFKGTGAITHIKYVRSTESPTSVLSEQVSYGADNTKPFAT